MQTNSPESGGFMAESAKRMTFWGSTTIGFLGIILAINAALSDEYTGAGVCLAASALAIGILGYTFIRR